MTTSLQRPEDPTTNTLGQQASFSPTEGRALLKESAAMHPYLECCAQPALRIPVTRTLRPLS